MNVTDQRKKEILELILKKYPEYSWVAMNKNGDAYVFIREPVKNTYTGMYHYRTEISEKGDECTAIYDLQITKLLLEISTDWKELCFELPKPSKEWKSDVYGVYSGDYSDQVVIDLWDNTDIHKYVEKLQAQQEIYDIIAKTQHEIEPDWVADWSDATQYKYYPFFSHITKRVCYQPEKEFQYLDSRMYMSEWVKHKLDKDRLISEELFLKAFC